MPTFIIGSRKSDLARLQAYRVGKALKAKFQDIEIQYQFKESLGDKNLTDPLWKMPEKGVFTEDFADDLAQGRVDMVVHSWKDLPTEDRPNTKIIATQEREDIRDLLVFKTNSIGKSNLKIMTSSPRRSYNLGPLLPKLLPFKVEDLQFENVRGNIPTRLQKMLDSECDGIIVAKAAIDRLLSAHEEEFQEVQAKIHDVLTRCYWMVLPLSINPGAAAQGALAIEVLKSRIEELRPYFEPIHCQQTYEDVIWERDLLRSFGGGCHQKLGMSQIQRDYGKLRFARGCPDDGDAFKTNVIAEGKDMPLPQTMDKIWPHKKGDYSGVFSRKQTNAILPKAFDLGVVQIWLAKHSALPDNWNLPEGSIVWAAGMKTWVKLAQRGVWVSGSAEGLGEAEDERLRPLLGIKPNWIKLTHQGAVKSAADIGTYKLKFNPLKIDFNNKTHFFWTSISMYEALKVQIPDSSSVVHACGLGATYRHLKAEGLEVYPFFNHRHWLEYVSEGVVK